MKKVLFGILALSIGAFAAGYSNPGTVNESGVEISSVPVKVRAEIVSAPEGLTITDEAGTVLDELLIDHGRIIAGQQSDDSVAFKGFKVKRFKAGESVALDSLREDENAAAGTIKIALDDKSTTLKHDGTNDDHTLASTLSLPTTSGAAYTHLIKGGETEHLSRVTSTIPGSEFTTAKNTGIYHNGAERTLIVTYTPGLAITR